MAINERLWRRGQLIGTGVLTLVCSPLLLWFAYLALGDPRHSSSEAVVLVTLALLLPALFYWGFAGALAVRRGREPDADPSLRSTRLMKSRYAPFLVAIPIGVMLSLNQGLSRLNEHLKHDQSSGDETQPVASRQAENIRAGCLSSMTAAAQRAGLAATRSATPARIDSYCTCFVLQVQSLHTPQELQRLEADSDRMAHDPKLNQALESCRTKLEGA